MNFDVAVIIYIALLCLLGTALGLKRQLLQIVTLVFSAVVIYLVRYNLLDAAGAGLHIYGFTARVALLVPLIALWFVIYRILLFLLRPFMRTPGRFSGALFALVRGLVDVAIVALFLVLAFPTLELRFPALADKLRDSTTFKATQLFDESKFNPLQKWPPYWRIRNIFFAPFDAVARDRLDNDPNYRDLQSTPSLFELMEDSDYQEAVQEGRFPDAMRNPKLRAFLNDEEAFLAFQAFLFGKGAMDAGVEVERQSAPALPVQAAQAPAPPPPPPPPPTQPPPKKKEPPAATRKEKKKEAPAAVPKDLKLIILNNGCRMTGIIRSMNDEEVDTDILMGQDFLNVTFTRSEIREIRDIGN